MSDFLKKKYVLQDDIFSFDILDSSTKKVTSFYKQTPFPNYKIDDNRSSILKKGDNNSLAYSRTINQIAMFFNNLGSDGGLFILIGKKY